MGLGILRVAAIPAVLAFVLAGCGSNSTPPAGGGKPGGSSSTGGTGGTGGTSGATEGKPQMSSPVSGKPIDKNVFVDYQGKRVYLASNDEKDTFMKDPDTYMRKLRDAGVKLENAPTGGDKTGGEKSGGGPGGTGGTEGTSGGTGTGGTEGTTGMGGGTGTRVADLGGDQIGKQQTVSPVSGKPVDKKFFVDYDGKRVYFANEEEKETFLESPQKFMRQMQRSGVQLENTPTGAAPGGAAGGAIE